MQPEESAQIAELQAKKAQLETAFFSRVPLEQAKGILAERYQLTFDDASLLLRYASRSSHRNMRDLATELISNRSTPNEIRIAMARQQRWRATAQRERAELNRELAAEKRARAERLLPRIRGESEPTGAA